MTNILASGTTPFQSTLATAIQTAEARQKSTAITAPDTAPTFGRQFPATPATPTAPGRLAAAAQPRTILSSAIGADRTFTGTRLGSA